MWFLDKPSRFAQKETPCWHTIVFFCTHYAQSQVSSLVNNKPHHHMVGNVSSTAKEFQPTYFLQSTGVGNTELQPAIPVSCLRFICDFHKIPEPSLMIPRLASAHTSFERAAI